MSPGEPHPKIAGESPADALDARAGAKTPETGDPIMDWTDIETKLCDRAEDVCRHLFPNGRREGAEYVVGSVAGEAGRSLKVNLAGKVGVWKDFAGDRGGKNLLSLWMHARNLARFGQAVVEAKQFLGLADDFQQRVQRFPTAKEAPDDSAWRAVAETWAKCQPLTPDGPVFEWLTKTRNLDPAVLEAFDVRELPSRGKWTMVFPYYAVRTEEKPLLPAAKAPEWLKFEALERPQGKKKEWTSKAPEKSLFGLQLAEHPLFAKCRHVLICEGEKDALAWASYGCQEWGVLPLSVPFGAKWKGQDKFRPSPNREWLDRCWDRLQDFETVFVQMDADEAGQRAAADIIAEIGPRRCRLVELPFVADKNDTTGAYATPRYKDANECLQKGVLRDQMQTALEQARDFAPEKIVAAADLEEEFLRWVFERPLVQGIELPFDFPLRLRRKEVTLWMGVKGCGKSTLLDFVTVAAIAQGERALVASFEMPWEDTHDKLTRQALGGLYFDKRGLKNLTPEVREKYLRDCRQKTVATHRWLARGLWYYVHVGIARWRQLIDDMRWARRRLGVTFFVVDNFMRLGISKDDYAQQADCMIAFAGLAMELEAHLVVVIHQEKTTAKKNRNDNYGNAATASGAHEIGDNAHNVVEIQRDDKKGKQMAELFDQYKVAQMADDATAKAASKKDFLEKKAALDQKPDGKFIMHNQRRGDVQDGSKYLWFLWESQQYADCPPGHPDHKATLFSAGKQPNRSNDLPTNEELGINQPTN